MSAEWHSRHALSARALDGPSGSPDNFVPRTGRFLSKLTGAVVVFFFLLDLAAAVSGGPISAAPMKASTASIAKPALRLMRSPRSRPRASRYRDNHSGSRQPPSVGHFRGCRSLGPRAERGREPTADK